MLFQWLFNGTPINDATNTTLSFVNIQPTNAGTYQLQAQNPYTNVLSPAIPVTVWRRPRIVTDHGEQLFDSRQILVQQGASVSFTPEVTGSPPFQFTWSSSIGTIITTNQTLSLTNIQFSQGDTYQCYIYNPYISLLASPAYLDLVVQVELPPGSIATWGTPGETNVPPPKNLSQIVALAAGFHHNLALLKDGTVFGWGSNQVGQLDIAMGQSNVVAIAAAGDYSLAVLDNGLVLGAGKSSWTPPLVPPPATNAALVSAGTNHVLVLRKDGSVFAWGRNPNGQINVPASLTDVIAVAAGATHSLALKRQGTVVGWGGNAFGQAQPPNGLSNVVAIAAGAQHSLALLNSGLVIGWGDNSNWQATGSFSVDSGYLAQIGVTNVIAIAAGDDFSIALRRDGQVLAWGAINRPGIAIVPPGLINGVQIAAGPGHSLALTGVPLALRPALTIERRADGLWVSWPLSATNYFLQGTPGLALPFTTLNAPTETNSNTFRTLAPATNQSFFFRLNGPF
jgi:hypothetical protein